MEDLPGTVEQRTLVMLMERMTALEAELEAQKVGRQHMDRVVSGLVHDTVIVISRAASTLGELVDLVDATMVRVTPGPSSPVSKVFIGQVPNRLRTYVIKVEWRSDTDSWTTDPRWAVLDALGSMETGGKVAYRTHREYGFLVRKHASEETLPATAWVAEWDSADAAAGKEPSMCWTAGQFDWNKV